MITYNLKTQSTKTAEIKPWGEHKQDTKSVTKWMKTDRAENYVWLCYPHSISCRSLRNFHIWLFKTSGFIYLSLTSSFTNMDFLKSHPLAPYTDSCEILSSSLSRKARFCKVLFSSRTLQYVFIHISFYIFQPLSCKNIQQAKIFHQQIAAIYSTQGLYPELSLSLLLQ